MRYSRILCITLLAVGALLITQHWLAFSAGAPAVAGPKAVTPPAPLAALPQSSSSRTPAPPPSNPSTLAQVERPVTLAQAYCRLQRSNTGLNLSGGIKMLTLNYELDENGDSGFTAFIQSKDCPEGLFSVVSLDSQGRTRRLLNCQTAASQEILLQAGIQGNIEYTATPPGRIPLAISGAGYFLVQCPTGIFLQRSGDFQLRGEEVWLGACSVLNRDGQTLTWNQEELDEFGCTSKGECPLVVEADPATSVAVNRTTLRYEGSQLPPPLRESRIFSGSLERLDEPDSGPMGPDWERLPVFTPPRDCDSI